MNKRIKKKKFSNRRCKRSMSGWVLLYTACRTISDKYEYMALTSYLPFSNISDSTRLRYRKRLCHQIMVNQSNYFTITGCGIINGKIPSWHLQYK